MIVRPLLTACLDVRCDHNVSVISCLSLKSSSVIRQLLIEKKCVLPTYDRNNKSSSYKRSLYAGHVFFSYGSLLKVRVERSLAPEKNG